MRRCPTHLLAAAIAVCLLPRPLAAQICVGDCPPLDHRVAINELIIGVGIALGTATLSACGTFDVDGDGVVGVNELVAAVNNAQQGCPGEPTSTPDGEPTPAPLSATPTITVTPAPGPEIGFFGVTLADDTVQAPAGMDPSGIPIYERLVGLGFVLVVEAHPGTTKRPVGAAAVSASGAPDLQIQATRNLGNGSRAVCDNGNPDFGGVPGIDPPRLDDPSIADALNDFGCRFEDGMKLPVGRACGEGCIRFEDGQFGCQSDAGGTVQFCGQISGALAFPPGDTLVTVRVRDVRGNLGPPAQLIVRIANQ